MRKYQIDIGFEQSTFDQGMTHFEFDVNLPSSAIHRLESNNGITIETTARSGFITGSYPITIDIRDGSLKDVFDAIVPQMGNYKWKFSDGVVNIFPARGRDPRFKRLLNLNVKRFHLPAGSKVKDIIVALLELPEFFEFRRRNRFTFSPVREGVSVLIKAQYDRPVPQEINLENIRFRDLLNKITKVKDGGWLLKIRGKTSEGGDLGDLDI